MKKVVKFIKKIVIGLVLIIVIVFIWEFWNEGFYEHIGGGYYKRFGSIYAHGYGGSCFSFGECSKKYKMPNADPRTFTYVGGQFAKDKHSAYYQREKIEGVDLETFQALSDIYAKDKNFVYYGSGAQALTVVKIPGADTNTIEVFYTGLSYDESINSCEKESYAKDQKAVYYRSEIIEGADPKSFSILKGGSFEPCYARDKNSLYYASYKIENSDPLTFEYINEDYAKDRNNVYYTLHYGVSNPCLGKACIIGEADPKTFKVFDSAQQCGPNCQFDAEDKNHKYSGWHIVQ